LLLFEDQLKRCKALAEKDDKRSERGKPNSGQVQHDDRGNAVWQWAADTARTAMASTSQVLRKLDLTGLSLESDQQPEDSEPANPADGPAPSRSAPSAPKPATNASPGTGKKRPVDTRKGGFNPYSTNAGTAKRAAAAAAVPKSAGGAKAAPLSGSNTTTRRAEVSSPRRASWWQRLLGRG
jgi:hypothetical protein